MPRTPIHPGEILSEELEEIGVSPKKLAETIRGASKPARSTAARRTGEGVFWSIRSDLAVNTFQNPLAQSTRNVT